MSAPDPQSDRWLEALDEADRAFLKRFVLGSGSLKALAEHYGVSYPTIRLRLDRLIDRIKLLDAEPQLSEFERRLRASYAEGRIDTTLFRDLLDSHRRTLRREAAAEEP